MSVMGDDIVAFGEKVLAVLDRGSFTSTYKYAVLLGLLDLALEKCARDGGAPTSVTTRELAEKVTELYWPHARPFAPAARVLGQNLPQRGKRGQAEIVASVERFRHEHPEASSARRARLTSRREWDRLVAHVEWKLIEMPLPRLQVVGGEPLEFLYTIGWTVDVRRVDVRSPEFDNSIRFLPGAAEALVRLASLLRPLIQREWAALLARFNALPAAALEDFLFGVDRAALASLRAPLRDFQQGACFYCRRRLDADDLQVDHFLPWARHADDAIENLVAAHATCNRAKSDHLAATEHLERWLHRAVEDHGELFALAQATGWESTPATSLAAVRGIYLRLPEQTLLWREHRQVERLRRADVAAVLV